MRTRLPIAIASLLLAAAACAQPALPTQTLAGQDLVVPRDLADRPVLLIVGFTRDSRAQTSEWARRVATDATLDAVATYQVAMLEDVPSLMRGFVTRGIRSDLPDELEARFLVVTEQTPAWKQLVEYAEDDAAYLALFDAAHELVWRGRGAVNVAWSMRCGPNWLHS